MPSPYERKTNRDTAPKVAQALRELRKIQEGRAKSDGWPKNRFEVPIADLNESFRESWTRLFAWLRELDRQPLAYSALFQIWLDAMNVRWPKGVFKYDLNARRRGRPAKNELGRKAIQMYRPRVVGYARVAKELLPNQYKSNAATATKRIKLAMAAYRGRLATKHGPMDDLTEIAHQMLGIVQADE